MKSITLFAALALFASVARTQTIVAAVDLKAANTLLTSKGSAQYYNSFGNPASIYMHGDHEIAGADGSTIAAESISTQEGRWFGTLTAQGVTGICYRAGLNIYAGTVSQGMGSGRMCYPAPPPSGEPPPTFPTTSCTSSELGCTSGCGPRCSSGGGVQTLASDQCYYDVWYGSVCNSPLVVNLGHGPYRFSGEDSPVLFDLDADGQIDIITWTAADADIAFLVLDRNGNGTIDNGGELFGNNPRKQNGTTATDGFDALGDFDENHDGVVDAHDAVWPRLRLWTDRNHDGFNEPGELSTPEDKGISAFGLEHHFTARHDRFGNTLRYKGEFIQDGHPHPYYDVYFRILQ
ncbi:MAG: hypothetical protein JWO97_4598 [Acidobacteria bacterium]|nr:hypothetical protein [Acidobacteriota bacterium]